MRPHTLIQVGVTSSLTAADCCKAGRACHKHYFSKHVEHQLYANTLNCPVDTLTPLVAVVCSRFVTVNEIPPSAERDCATA